MLTDSPPCTWQSSNKSKSPPLLRFSETFQLTRVLSPGKMHSERKKTSEEAQLQKNSVSVVEQLPDHNKWSDHGVNIHSEDIAILLIKTHTACKFLWMLTKNRTKSPRDVFTVSSDDTKSSKIIEELDSFPRHTCPFCLTQLRLVHYLVPSEKEAMPNSVKGLCEVSPTFPQPISFPASWQKRQLISLLPDYRRQSS